MSIENKYTDEQWNLISALPQAIGMSMAGIKFSGLIGTSQEMFASVKAIMNAKNIYPNNTIIREISSSTDNASETINSAKEQRQDFVKRMKENGVDSTEKLQSFVLEDCQKTVDLLERHEDSTTVSEYKAWLLDIAHKVANAAKEGDFFGFGGERFSEKEREFYSKLKDILS